LEKQVKYSGTPQSFGENDNLLRCGMTFSRPIHRSAGKTGM